MSGHSRWHKVRQYKGGIDAKRASAFTKLSKNIIVAARLGGGDPNMNIRLRVAIENAKKVSLPKDTIERAIKRGTGELGGETVVETLYEALGPGKVGLIIACQTDNTNRAVSEVKNVITKAGYTMAGQNAVAWNFDKVGEVQVPNSQLEGKNWDEVELQLIDGGAQDIIRDEDLLIVRTPVNDFGSMLKVVEQLKLTPDESGFAYIPKETKKLSPEEETALEELLESLDDLDDVDRVFHNAA